MLREGRTYKFQHTEHSVNVPSLVWCIPLSGQTYLRSHAKLEFVICHLKESKQLPSENSDGVADDECIR